MSIPNLLVQIKRARRFLQVFHDSLSSRNRVLRPPWVEVESQGMQIRVGSHAGVSELRPCSTEFVARFKNGKFGFGERFLDAVGGVDTTEAAADYQDVKVRVDHGGPAVLTVLTVGTGCRRRYAAW